MSYIRVTGASDHKLAILPATDPSSALEIVNQCHQISDIKPTINAVRLISGSAWQRYTTTQQATHQVDKHAPAPLTGFFRRIMVFCWHSGQSRTLSPACRCSSPPADLPICISGSSILSNIRKSSYFVKKIPALTIKVHQPLKTSKFLSYVFTSMKLRSYLSKKIPIASNSFSFCVLACKKIFSHKLFSLSRMQDLVKHEEQQKLVHKQAKKSTEWQVAHVHWWRDSSFLLMLPQELEVLFSYHRSQLSCHSPLEPEDQASTAHVWDKHNVSYSQNYRLETIRT